MHSLVMYLTYWSYTRVVCSMALWAAVVGGRVAQLCLAETALGQIRALTVHWHKGPRWIPLVQTGPFWFLDLAAFGICDIGTLKVLVC